MEVALSQGSLATALPVCRKVVGATPTGLGEAVLLETTDGRGLRILGTNFHTVFSTEVDARVEAEGSVVVSGKWLQNIVQAVGSEEVRLRASEVDGKVELYSENSKFVLRTIPRDSFPEVGTDIVDATTRVTIPQDEFQKAVSQVVVAAGHKDARPVFTGCLVEAGDGEVKLVATDSYRLAERRLSAKVEGDRKKVVIDAKLLKEFSRLKAGESNGKVELEFGEDSGVLTIGKNRLRTRYVEGTFPDYEHYFPKDSPNRLLVSRDRFIDSVQRVSVLARDFTPVKIWLFKEKVVVEVWDSQIGEASDTIKDAIYSGDDEGIAINPKYLLDAVWGCDGEKVSIEFKDPFSGILIRGEESDVYRHLMMPIRQ